MQTIVISTLMIVLLVLGVVIFNQDKGSKSNKIFLGLMAFSIFWIISNYLSNTLKDYAMVLWSNRLIFVSTIYLSWMMCFLSLVYPSRDKKIPAWKIFFGWGSATIVSLVSLTDAVVKQVEIFETHSNIEFGLGLYLYVFIFGINFILFCFNIYRLLVKSSGLEKSKVQYLFIGLVLASIGAITTNLILPLVFGLFEPSNWGPLFLVIFVAFIGYSIAKHRLFGIRFVLGQIFSFTIRTILPFSFAFVILYVFSREGVSNIGLNTILLLILLSLLFAFIYRWIVNTFDAFIERKFLYAGMEPGKLIEEIRSKIETEFDINKINIEIKHFLTETLEVEFYYLVVFDSKVNNVLYVSDSHKEKIPDADLLFLSNTWEDKTLPEIIVQDELEYTSSSQWKSNTFKELLLRNKVECLISLNRLAHVKGYLILGPRRYGVGYKQEDLVLINKLVYIVSSAVSRALLYTQVQQFNTSLKQRVDEQTVELSNKVLQLVRAQTKERDMIDIMGHELRTPASVVKMNVDLLQRWKTRVGKESEDINTWEDFNKYIMRISDSIENEIGIINTLLTSAKLEGNKLELNKTHVDVIKAVQLSLEGHMKEIEQKGLNIKFDENIRDIPKVLADKGRFQEIVDNLIGNAVKYTHQGGVAINCSVIGDFVKVSVIDTGQGISQEDINQLGQKFYRTNQYIKEESKRVSTLVRPGGTGLGLYVVFGLIRAHGGTVNVSSVIGKGSVFSFTMPIAHGQLIEEDTIYGGNMFDKMKLKK